MTVFFAEKNSTKLFALTFDADSESAINLDSIKKKNVFEVKRKKTSNS